MLILYLHIVFPAIPCSLLHCFAEIWMRRSGCLSALNENTDHFPPSILFEQCPLSVPAVPFPSRKIQGRPLDSLPAVFLYSCCSWYKIRSLCRRILLIAQSGQKECHLLKLWQASLHSLHQSWLPQLPATICQTA